ncbi:uncharacterized protein LOC143364136 [Halictus rubicundus]|uniref:uncharacterized protein LOC143364136 n=1 Tax=Halictus rubicundus TaxID=77578 RepID=UPI0040371D2B
MGRSTVELIVKETCKAIVTRLTPETMPTPTQEMWGRIREQFWEKCQFPNCVGAIDGNISPSRPQRIRDRCILITRETTLLSCLPWLTPTPTLSPLKLEHMAKIATAEFSPNREWDANGLTVTLRCCPTAFPLKRHLLRPYPGSQAEGTEDKTFFNTRLSIARRVVESAFGILSQKFRLYNRRIQGKPDNIDTIVLATCHLHNFIRAHEGTHGPQTSVEEDAPNAFWAELSHHGGNSTREAFEVRDSFKDYIFAR